MHIWTRREKSQDSCEIPHPKDPNEECHPMTWIPINTANLLRTTSFILPNQTIIEQRVCSLVIYKQRKIHIWNGYHRLKEEGYGINAYTNATAQYHTGHTFPPTHEDSRVTGNNNKRHITKNKNAPANLKKKHQSNQLTTVYNTI